MSRPYVEPGVPEFVPAERSLIGAVFLDAGVLDRVQLRADQFYDPKNRVIWTALHKVRAANDPIDPITVGNVLGAQLDAVGGLAALGGLAIETPTADNAEHYAELVREYDRRRQLMLVGGGIVSAAKSGIKGGLEIQAEALESIRRIDTSGTSRLLSMGDVMAERYEAVTRMVEQAESGEVVITDLLPTGIAALNTALGGIAVGIPTVLVARPGMGKSALKMTIAEACIRAGVGVLEYQLEDTEQASADRFLSRVSGVSATDIRLGKISRADMAKITAGLNEWHQRCNRFWKMDNRGDLTGEQIVRDTRRNRGEVENLKLVIVDLLNELQWPKHATDETKAMSRNFRTLAMMAREDNLAVLILAQLGRKVDERTDKRPRIADIKQTGAMEERGKCVLGLYRGVEYGMATEGVDYERGEDRPSEYDWQRRVEICVLKNNHGRSGLAVRATWDGPTVRIS